MSRIKVLHTADLHLGVETYGITGQDGINSRIKDYLETLDWLVLQAKSLDCDAFLVAGDIFDNERPTNYVISEFAKRIRNLVDSSITVILTPGNHETSSSSRVPSALEVFRALHPQKDGTEIACHVLGCQPSRPGDTETMGGISTIPTKSGNLQILAMPYPRRSEILTSEQMKNRGREEVKKLAATIFLDRIQELARKALPGLPTIFVGHFGIKEAELRPGVKGYLADDVIISTYDLMSKLSDSQAKFGYVALGHYHSPQMPSPNLVAPSLDEDMDGEASVLCGTNPCRDWELSSSETVAPDPDSLFRDGKPVRKIQMAYSGAPSRRDFSDGARTRMFMELDLVPEGSSGKCHKVEHSRSLRQLTIDDVLNWKEELEAKFLKSEFWHQPYEYAATGCGQEQIEKTMKGPLPIFRLRLPEEARPIWPAIKSWLDTLPMFDKIITPYYKPSARESQKAVITQTESPVEAVKSYLDSLQDDFAKTNRARIQEEAERIMQEARVV
ncbi:MAG TPA: exonuclease subunit SbcD [Caldisericia bacterium]|mgnify:FL=1|nr:exonuclease subunit SbcD [Caldisericia bacterium]HQG60140.1 exonuclease subunit SbcD [Caldisericia bacterium]HQH48448.1 exonuclease subunit SbcD [Caldisericia bacterium]HQJ44265.1 exonuclease subunit SbcD [Caldisericia bacterium]